MTRNADAPNRPLQDGVGLPGTRSRYLRVLLGVALFLTAFPLDASAWWDPAWGQRRILRFGNGGQPSNLLNFPVLVVLTPARIDYAKTQGAGQDLRFVDADDNLLLNHEIERWTPGGTSYVWVSVPQVDASSNTDFIYMYYGNPGVGALPAVAAENTWDANFRMVQHLEETSGTHFDSTSFNTDSTYIHPVIVPTQGTAAGQIDGTDTFVRASDTRIEVVDNGSLDMANGDSFTVEAWVRTGFTTAYPMAFSKESRCTVCPDGDGEIQMFSNGGTASFWLNDGVANTARIDSATFIADNVWHYLVGRWNNAGGGTAELFVDGVSVGTAAGNPGNLGPITTNTPGVIGDEGDDSGGGGVGQASWDGLLDEIRVAKVLRSNDWIRAQNLSMRDTFVTFLAEASNCCGLVTTETATTVTVLGPNRFRMQFNKAVGGGIDQFFDMEENPTATQDLAGGTAAALQPTLFSDEVSVAGTSHTTGANVQGAEMDLLEATQTRVKVRQEAFYEQNGTSSIVTGVKGYGDYSIYAIGKLAVGWERRATSAVVTTLEQLQLSVHYQAAAPLNVWQGWSETAGPFASFFAGSGAIGDDFLLARIEQPLARTDFLTILNQDWAAAPGNTTFSGNAGQEFEELTWTDNNGSAIPVGSQRWNFLTYFKPTNINTNADAAVLSKRTDYRTPEVPYNLSNVSQWQDAAENTSGGGDFFNESEAAYVFNATPGSNFSFDMNGFVTNRHYPFFKFRQWHSFGPPATVTLEGVPLVRDTNYKAAVKPVARAYFAQDVIYHSTLESAAYVTTASLQTGNWAGSTVNGAVTFPVGRFGSGAQFSADGQYLSIAPAGNFDPTQGAIEFWYKPSYTYGAGGSNSAFFGYWIDANNYFYAWHQPGATAADGLKFEIRRTSTLYQTTVGALPASPVYWRANEWVHLRFVWRSGATPLLEIYLNGALVSPAPTGSYAAAGVATEATFNIGDRGLSDLFTDNANGIIDEFQIFSSSGAPTPIAHGGLTTDPTEYLAEPTRNFTLNFDPFDGFFRGEYLYIGADSKFRGLNIGMATPGAGVAAGALLWEYWDGVRWSNLESAVGVFTDETNSFTRPRGSVFWDVEPASWTLYSISGGPDLYYVRMSLGGGVDYTTTPIESGMKTDILLFQYCGNILSLDRTFAFTPPAPTAVSLQSFSAIGRDAAVDLSWSTATELQNLGFHLYRAESEDGPYTRITSSLIPGLGSSPTGQSYSYVDAGVVNGRKYFYKLEDVETTGRTELHGPVSATPAGSSTGGGGSPPSTPPGPSGTSYGDPTAVSLREVERSPQHVVLELLTGGFLASPAEEGRVRLRIPGFESASQAGEPELPMRRALVAAAAGRKVRLVSVLASDDLRFAGLRPVSQGIPEIETSEDGSVRPSQKATREGRAFRELFPGESARLEGTAFQGETKKAEVLFFPLRWDGSGLTLSRRLLVRLEFTGTEAKESSRGGSQGRRWLAHSSFAQSEVVAQIAAQERGLYRVDYEDVFPPVVGARRPRGILATNLRLSRQGESVAFHLEPGGVLFAPGSSLYFLSEGSSLNPYADAVYELETKASGLLMGEETLSPTMSKGVGEYFETVRREENHYYQSGLLEAPDLWLWDIVVSPGSNSFAFTTNELAASSSAGRLRVVLQGVSDFPGVLDHHVKVRVNGVFVGETTWDGATEQMLEMEVPPGAFLEGANSLSLENVGDTGASYSMVFLNRFSVSYPRRLVATQGKLEGRFERTGPAEIEGASVSSFVLDTTAVPRWLTGASATPNRLSLSVEAGKSYLVTSTFLRPAVKRLAPSGLKDTTNQADYLLLGPQAFLQAAQPLLELRESQGLVTKAVSLEEIYERFGHGEVSPEAIKEFLEYAYHFWAAPSPRYVLLLGDASYDPRDHLNTGVKDWLPGFPVRTSYLWTVSDPAYASVNGDDLLPDLAIGRLPAASIQEAEKMVQKVLLFEGGGGDFSGAAVLVADNADQAGDFEATADDIAATVLAARNPKKIYYSLEGANTRTKIHEAFNDGASLMSYIGHGSTVVWASENFFNYQDVPLLAPQPQQPLLLTLNCLNGFFQFPPMDSLSEALLKAEGKGVVAAFSPSGLSVNDPAHLFHKALLQEILSGQHARIGDAVLAAQEAYAQTGVFPELLSIYHLFGDPALRIQ